jgi:preprotein translocase subunit YajC
MDMRFLLQDPPAGAGQTGQPPKGGEGGPDAGPSPWLNVLPLVVIFAIMWILLIRPQRRQQKQRDQMIANIKKNDHVLTSGGIFGIVDQVKDDRVILKIDEKHDVRVRVAKTAITGVEKVAGAEGDTKPEAKDAVKK